MNDVHNIENFTTTVKQHYKKIKDEFNTLIDCVNKLAKENTMLCPETQIYAIKSYNVCVR